MVLTIEQPVEPTAVKPLGSAKIHGSVDYMATVVPQAKAGKSIGLPSLPITLLTPVRPVSV